MGILKSFIKGYSYTSEEGQKISEAAAYRIKGMLDQPVGGKKYPINGYKAAELIEQEIPGRAHRVIRGFRKVIFDTVTKRLIKR
ncbi:hypothetical protein JXD20_00035 [Candidatus Peregrinibacteria bacterium]|nr:hypothetical protein [Candidatus Peregrinibacteria bacterium]